ncbi:DUF7280 family protein [Mycolicibacterium rufum]
MTVSSQSEPAEALRAGGQGLKTLLRSPRPSVGIARTAPPFPCTPALTGAHRQTRTENTMTITTAIITANAMTSLDHPVDCLVDTLIEAQRLLGQINWNTITSNRARGTYRSPDGTPASVTVVDTQLSPDLLAEIQTWMARS